MSNAQDMLFKTLADPTRRAIFERLCREGEQTVGALTARAGVSQPAVSKHLGVLKQAGMVRDRHQGRQTHYSAQLAALAPLVDWTTQMAGFWETHLRMEQSGFRPDQEQAYQGAQYGWRQFFAKLDDVLAGQEIQAEAQ